MEEQVNLEDQSFHLKLFKTFPSNSNLIFSPFSIYTTLCMAAMGSEGNTLIEFQKALGFEYKEELTQKINKETQLLKKIPQIQIANKLYHNLENINGQYLQQMRDYFQNSIEHADFNNNLSIIVSQINQWVEEKTKGMIKEAIDLQNISESTRLVLINAIYFRDDWLYKFKESDTKKDKYFLTKGSILQNDTPHKIVDMMYQQNNFLYYEDNLIQYLSIPYQNENVKMEIILPKGDLKEFESMLNYQQIQQIRQQASYFTVDLYLPRFKIEDKISRSLQGKLNKIGLNDCFDRIQANFEGICKYDLDILNLYLQDVFHRAIIEVNEKGTKAAASTSAFTMQCSSIESIQIIKTFYCNKPFLFMISDTNTNLCFFMGRVIEPEILEEPPNQIVQFLKKIFCTC